MVSWDGRGAVRCGRCGRPMEKCSHCGAFGSGLQRCAKCKEVSLYTLCVCVCACVRVWHKLSGAATLRQMWCRKAPQKKTQLRRRAWRAGLVLQPRMSDCRVERWAQEGLQAAGSREGKRGSSTDSPERISQHSNAHAAYGPRKV